VTSHAQAGSGGSSTFRPGRTRDMPAAGYFVRQGAGAVRGWPPCARSSYLAGGGRRRLPRRPLRRGGWLMAEPPASRSFSGRELESAGTSCPDLPAVVPTTVVRGVGHGNPIHLGQSSPAGRSVAPDLRARRGPDDTNRSVEIAGHGNPIHTTPTAVAPARRGPGTEPMKVLPGTGTQPVVILTAGARRGPITRRLPSAPPR
jgi:hypothetical protein